MKEFLPNIYKSLWQIFLIGVSSLVIGIIIGTVLVYLDVLTTSRVIEKIDDINTIVDRKNIYITFKLKEPATCKEILKALDIQTIKVEGRHFSPVCKSVNEKLIKVVYTEDLVL